MQFDLWGAIWIITKNTGTQIFLLMGALLISGMILTLISKWTHNSFRQFRFPHFGLYTFGVIGVPLHELCHAIFAKIFFHKIGKIKWFDPQGKGGAYGFVTHYYNDKNVYHRIGLFFIGLGPVLLAPTLLFAMAYFLVPHTHMPWSGGNTYQILIQFKEFIVSKHNWTHPGFYVFLYLSICLTSQMELSSADLQIVRGGLAPIMALILILNTLAYACDFDFHRKMMHFMSVGFTLWSGGVFVAILISICNLFVCYLVLNLFNRSFGEPSINPFRDE